jgi:hypothetical protein
MQSHVKLLAILNIVFGSLLVLAGVIVMVVLGGIGLAGAASTNSEDAAVALPILGGIGGIIFVVLLIIGLPQILAGWGLLNYKPWARILTIVLSVLHLFSFPLGTALGVYGLWVLLKPETEALFRQPPMAPAIPGTY